MRRSAVQAELSAATPGPIAEGEYRRRVNAWCMYDWANSAFATTILAVVLPIYYSQVAGATLPSAAVATSYWSIGLSVSLFIVAILSPILGTISDVMRGKKRFLSVFATIGIIGTGLLVLVDTGDWLLASLLFVVGRIGFTASVIFSDALLPHVAREGDQDRVSTRGYALGYLGGGLLLAINVVMIQFLPGNWGARLSFLSVAIWWAIFSIPVLTRVPEPPAATATQAPGENVVTVSFRCLWETIQDIRRYRELFKYLVAFLIYNDGIGTIIGVAAIYGAELGFGDIELILAILLVQFVGIPFSLIFGRLPQSPGESSPGQDRRDRAPGDKAADRRPLFLAFILFNLVVLPLVGIVGARTLAAETTGAPLPAYEDTATAVGEGTYLVDDAALNFAGTWQTETVAADKIGADEDAVYQLAQEPGARYDFTYNGQEVEITYSTGPDRGIWMVEIDGQPYIDEDTDDPLELDAYNKTVRYSVRETFTADEPGEHTLSVINSGEKDEKSTGTLISLAEIEVLPPIRQNNLPMILGLIVVFEVIGAVFAWLLGRQLFSGLAELMDTRRSIILALVVYAIIAIWGFFLDSTIEFWLLAWMVAMVQGGSQALSRSLYASMSPAAKSGEFFGLYGVMEKFSAIMGPLLFAAAATLFDSSRPAVLSLIVLFFLGIFLLRRVNIEEGRRVAREEDAAVLGTASGA
jgi:MFS-type transporter involved in bile tolerance (Atg22 family)